MQSFNFTLKLICGIVMPQHYFERSYTQYEYSGFNIENHYHVHFSIDILQCTQYISYRMKIMLFIDVVMPNTDFPREFTHNIMPRSRFEKQLHVKCSTTTCNALFDTVEHNGKLSFLE